MRWLRRVFRKSRDENRLDQELRFHLEQHIAANVAAGMPMEEARRRAQLEFGGLERVKEEVRDTRWETRLDTLFRDFRYALRTLRKAPGFAAVAIITLALGIGANTAIFSVVYAVLLKPLPYGNPGQLFNVFQAKPQDGITGTGWSYLNFAELREQTGVFSEMAGAQQHQLTLTAGGDPSVVNTSVVTPELFALFGEKPLAGRVFFSEDGKPGAPPVVILGENLWLGSFGADPRIIGNSINLDKRPYTIIGIMPATFHFPLLNESDQVWIPLVHDPLFGGMIPRRAGHWLQVTGRLKPGVSMAQAQAELDAIGTRLAKEFPAENSGWVIRMVPLQQMIVGNVKSALLVLLGAVGLVLLIACANIANLLLTRATSRSREIAVRIALGAGRNRIVRQLLCETAVLGLLGGVAGIFLAYWGVQGLSSLLPQNLPLVNAIRVDNFVLCFALLLSAIASCAFGLAPALFAANSNLQTSLREGGRSGESSNRRRARSVLAAAEIALAMVLLVAAGLLIRSFSKLLSVSPGFDVQHIVKADVSLPRFQYSMPQQWSAFSDELLSRIQSQPGLHDAAIAVPLPITDGRVNLAFDIAGTPPASAGGARLADYVSVSPDYFRVMSIPLLAGRFFNQHDGMSEPRVSVISQAMARLYFSNQNPLGRRLTFGFPPGREGVEREIVGIVGDVRDVALSESPGPMMYVPFAQEPFWGGAVIVKSTLSTSSVAAAIRREVLQMDKDLPVTGVAELTGALDSSLAEQRFRTLLLGMFAGMALILAAIGIFGVISYSVSRRTHEMGIRVALGASRATILRMVLRETLGLTLAGLAVGIPCTLAASRLLGHMLFGVSSHDLATLATVAFVLAAVAVFAGYLPARRATRVDPLVALRYE